MGIVHHIRTVEMCWTSRICDRCGTEHPETFSGHVQGAMPLPPNWKQHGDAVICYRCARDDTNAARREKRKTSKATPAQIDGD